MSAVIGAPVEYLEPELRVWQDKAACADFYAETGTDAWFGPDEDEREAFPDEDAFLEARRESRAIAVSVCAWCPVRTDCLRYAMRTESPVLRAGIWGGLTPGQRTSLHRKMQQAAAAKAAA